jgi:hypothetical protein
LGRDSSHDGHQGRRIAVIDKMMLGQPNVVETQRFAVYGQRDVFAIDIGPGTAREIWIAKGKQKTAVNAHGRPLSVMRDLDSSQQRDH